MTYERRVESTPKREQELMALQRDYENLQESYSSLLNRKLEADISVNMERKQKGEQFRVLDQARLPKRPVQPNMQMLFLITIAAGLGVGGHQDVHLRGARASSETMKASARSDRTRLGLDCRASVCCAPGRTMIRPRKVARDASPSTPL